MSRSIFRSAHRWSLFALALLLCVAPPSRAELVDYYPNLLVTLEGNQAELAWTSTSGMGGYRLLFDETPATEAFDGRFDHAIDVDWGLTLSAALPQGGSYHVAVEGYNQYTGDYTRPSNVEHVYVGDITQLAEVGLPAPQNLRFEQLGNDVTLSWDPVEDALGYRLYLGEATGDYDYETPFDLGNITSLYAPGLPSGMTWYAAVTAYGIRDNPVGGPYPYPRCESRFSNEVVVVTDTADGRWQRDSLITGEALVTDFSASTIVNADNGSMLVISGSVPPELFPDGAKLSVDLQVKTPNHPEGYSRPVLADTFRVFVNENGAVYAEMDHDEPYPPISYQLVILFRQSANYTNMGAAVAANMEEHFGISYSDPMLVATKDITVGTRAEHFLYRRAQLNDMYDLLGRMIILFDDMEARLILPSADDPDVAGTVAELVAPAIEWSTDARALAARYKTVQELSLIGTLRTFDTWMFQILSSYEDGVDVVVNRELGEMRDALAAYRLRLERKRYVVDRVLHLRMPRSPAEG